MCPDENDESPELNIPRLRGSIENDGALSINPFQILRNWNTLNREKMEIPGGLPSNANQSISQTHPGRAAVHPVISRG